MDVSIVVLAWQDVHRTRDCVLSLPPEAEIVVVDNGSAAEIREALRRFCRERGVTYVQAGSNLGYARGMNLGVRHCSRSVVVLSNNDIVVPGDAVSRLAAALEDPDVGAAFPATGLSLVVPRLRIVAPPERADWLTGPFVAMRRSTLDTIGGVDESSFFYGEDMRLCWAVRRRGLRLAYLPDAVVVHEDDATARRRWSVAEIARRRTREFIRASRELGGRRGRLAAAAYVFGVLLRAAVGPSPVRRAIARGALEGMRAG
jgi:N-acetylglucosaminyl-diphospho-decaprenol L-rhamnosyltransferase